MSSHYVVNQQILARVNKELEGLQNIVAVRRSTLWMFVSNLVSPVW